jgi:tRNA(Ile)-lysidine synthase
VNDAPHLRFAADARALLGRRKALLAVSGGPDSLALVAAGRAMGAAAEPPPLVTPQPSITACARKRRTRPRLAAQAAALGLPHSILRWTGREAGAPAFRTPPATARYALARSPMPAPGRRRRRSMTAHHADDQAETDACSG